MGGRGRRQVLCLLSEDSCSPTTRRPAPLGRGRGARMASKRGKGRSSPLVVREMCKSKPHGAPPHAPRGGGEQPQRDGGLGGRGGAGAPTCRRWGCEVVQTLQKGLGAPEPECHRVTQRSQFQARTQKRCPRAPRGRPSWAVDAARLHRHTGRRSAVETRSADTRACPGLGTRRAEEAGAAGGAPWGPAAGAGAADRWSPRPGAGGRNGATARERGARNVGLESREGCTTGGKCPHC